MASLDENLTYQQVATYLNVKIGTVYSWVARGEIPHVRLGRRVVRFPKAEIQKWMAARLMPCRDDLGASAAQP